MRDEKKSEMGSILSAAEFLPQQGFSIEDCYSVSTSSFNGRLHFHDFYELSLVYEGSSEFFINGRRFRTECGSLQLIRPSDYHRQMTAEGEYIRYYNLTFTQAMLSEPLRRRLEDRQEPVCIQLGEKEREEFFRLMRAMKKEYEMPDDPLAGSLIKCGIETACIMTVRRLGQMEAVHTALLPEAVRRGMVYVQKNYRLPVRLSEAAAEAGLSETYFSAIFHAYMGVSFSCYLSGYRLKMAERYLQEGSLPLKQIAAACGFASYPYFLTAFRKRYGLPPAAYQKSSGDGVVGE